jgi:hypothetical protein
MIVVVETNYIVELILQQEEAAACEELRSLCTNTSARMVVPSFAIAEAGMVLERRSRERLNFIRTDLAGHAREVGRAKTLSRVNDILRALDDELLSSERDVAAAWFHFRVDLDRMEVIPMTAEILEETMAIQLGREIDRLPDAIIFASVKKYLEDARRSGIKDPACFVSRDDKAFGTSKILNQLRRLDCTFVNSFPNAAARVRASIDL